MKGFLILFLSISLMTVSTTLVADEDCQKVSGSSIFRENPDVGAEEAEKVALSRGMIDFLSSKIPLQFLKIKYPVIKKEFIENSHDYTTEIKQVAKVVKGHSVKIVLCVRWNEVLISRKLEELAIIPRGILPPPLNLNFNLFGTFPSSVTWFPSVVTQVVMRVVKGFNFSLTDQGFRYKISFTIYSRRIRGLLLFTPAYEIGVTASILEKNWVISTDTVSFYYPFLSRDSIENRIGKFVIPLLEKVRLHWFKNIKRLKRLPVLIPFSLRGEAIKIFTFITKNSSTVSLLRIAKLTPVGLWITVYYPPKVGRDDVLKEISEIISDKGLIVKYEKGYAVISNKE